MAINGWTCTAHYQHMMTTEERQTIQLTDASVLNPG